MPLSSQSMSAVSIVDISVVVNYRIVSGILSSPLYKHQRQALYWMLHREIPNMEEALEDPSIPSFWEVKTDKSGQKHYVNVILRREFNEKPPWFMGGILADDVRMWFHSASVYLNIRWDLAKRLP